jgi:rhamnulokinase
LLGVVTDGPVVNATAARWNLTNERGIGGSNRLLANIMGLWILEGCRQSWERAGLAIAGDYPALLHAAAAAKPFQAFVQPDDPRFFHPTDMLAAVRAFLAETSQSAPSDPPSVTRIVLESLALRYATILAALEQAQARKVHGCHVIGGGAHNTFLNQATADACQRPVQAGPTEATALGNLLVQALADGACADLAAARAIVRRSIPIARFEPSAENAAAWQDARERFAALAPGHA